VKRPTLTMAIGALSRAIARAREAQRACVRVESPMWRKGTHRPRSFGGVGRPLSPQYARAGGGAVVSVSPALGRVLL
jgi:hypothetical protein